MSISALVSNSLCVDSIILTVRTDESYVRDTVGIVDPYYDSILVPRDIEDRSSVLEETCVADIAQGRTGRAARRACGEAPGSRGAPCPPRARCRSGGARRSVSPAPADLEALRALPSAQRRGCVR